MNEYGIATASDILKRWFGSDITAESTFSFEDVFFLCSSIANLEMSEELAQQYALKQKNKIKDATELLKDAIGCSVGDDIKDRIEKALEILR